MLVGWLEDDPFLLGAGLFLRGKLPGRVLLSSIEGWEMMGGCMPNLRDSRHNSAKQIAASWQLRRIVLPTSCPAQPRHWESQVANNEGLAYAKIGYRK